MIFGKNKLSLLVSFISLSFWWLIWSKFVVSNFYQNFKKICISQLLQSASYWVVLCTISLTRSSNNEQKQVNFSEACYWYFFYLLLEKSMKIKKKNRKIKENIKGAFYSLSFVWWPNDSNVFNVSSWCALGKNLSLHVFGKQN